MLDKTSDVVKFFFTDFVWPITAICLLVFGLCTLFGYIVFKLQSEKNTTSFKSRIKKWVKYALSIYLGILILNILFILLTSPDYSSQILGHIYWQVDSVMRNIEPWIMNNGFLMLIILSSLTSLILLVWIFQQFDFKMSIKAFVIYLLISIPIISGILYLTTQISLLTIIIIIGIPGALISYIIRG